MARELHPIVFDKRALRVLLIERVSDGCFFIEIDEDYRRCLTQMALTRADLVSIRNRCDELLNEGSLDG